MKITGLKILAVAAVFLILCIAALPVAAAGATPSLHVVKYARDRETVISTRSF